MNKIFNTARNFKEDLNNLEYVKKLTTLHPAERNILFQKYKRKASKTFHTALSKAKNILDVEAAFQKTLNQANKFIKNSKWHNPVINNKSNYYSYNHGAITIIGYEHQTDKELIALHKYQLESKQSIKQERLLNKINKIKNLAQQCDKTDALALIKVLKNKYKL